jgi:hypothetical protein
MGHAACLEYDAVAHVLETGTAHSLPRLNTSYGRIPSGRKEA